MIRCEEAGSEIEVRVEPCQTNAGDERSHLIKPGMDSRAVIQRFEQERQALAMMDHPIIAKVLDGGMTPSGQPFFVMELVNGLPLTRFCDEAKMTPRQRLELFVPICQAVQHAHQKGIIHRDLKPANILVTMVDGRPVPKVIDFGVAKATGGKLTDEWMSTQLGSIVGTLEYMSPEQAGFLGADIDTRADIYSLGVILYELLTGLRPIDARRLKQAALMEMIRMIREEEPCKPSTRLSTDESLPSLAAVRQTEPRRLMAMLRGELDWVVMKCLEKERDRRYESANGVARDIQRYVADEPVEARPPSAGYRLAKFLRRNKGPVLAASLLFLALLAGIAGTTWGFVREAKRARGERLANEQAQARLLQGEKANEILGSVFESLDPQEIAKAERPLQAHLVDKLDSAIAQLDSESIGDPNVQADLQTKLGSSLWRLGKPQKAIGPLEKAVDTFRASLGPDDLKTLDCMDMLATAYEDSDKNDLGLALLEEVHRRAEATYGREHRDTIRFLRTLGEGYQKAGKIERALPIFESALAQLQKVYGPDDPQTLICMNDLATCYRPKNRDADAIPLLEEALRLTKAKLGSDNPTILTMMANLGESYAGLKKYDQARPLLEEAYRRARATLGTDHPDTIQHMRALAGFYRAIERPDLFLPLIEQVAKQTEATFGPGDNRTLGVHNNLAAAYWSAKQLDKSIPMFEQLLQRRETLYGRQHVETPVVMMNLGTNYLSAGRSAEAQPLLEEAYRNAGLDRRLLDSVAALSRLYEHQGNREKGIELLEGAVEHYKKLSPDLPATWDCMSRLGNAYFRAREFDKAIYLFEELLKRQETRLGRQHLDTIRTVANLGANYTDAGRLAEAVPLLEEAYRARKGDPSVGRSGTPLLDAYVRAARTDQAVALAHELLVDARKTFPNDSPQLAGQLASLSLALLEVKEFTEAETLIRECLGIREKTEPESWTTFNTKSMLGKAFLGQKKYAEAEPFLLSGYNGMKRHDDEIPAQGKVRLTEATKQLVHLYEATGKPDEAAKWRKEAQAAQATQKTLENKQ